MISIKSVLRLNRLNVKSTKIVKTFGTKRYYSTNNLIKTIEFRTCGQLYDNLRLKNPKIYRNSPSDGVKVNIEYVDTFADKELRSSGDVKTIVAIHGIPGYHQHFKGLFGHFGRKGSRVRVIAPNMPDFGLTRQTMAFWHSNLERSQFIRDFLKAIDVSNVDCLVSHSAGLHVVSLLWTEPRELKILSLGLFAPQPIWFPKGFFALAKFITFLTQYKFGIKLMDLSRLHVIAHKTGYPLIYDNVDEIMLTAVMSTIGLDQNQLHQRLEYLKNSKISTLIVHGERDKLIFKHNYEQFLRDLDLEQRDIDFYSSDKTLLKSSERNKPIKLLSFENGGHFACNKFSEVVNKQIEQHLLKIY